MIIQVLRPETAWRRVWATIGYGWEPADYYRHWGSLRWTSAEAAEMKGPFLDPLNAQSEESEALLELFGNTVLTPDYIDRLQRHYRMFRAALRPASNTRAVQEARRRENRRKRKRDPRRR